MNRTVITSVALLLLVAGGTIFAIALTGQRNNDWGSTEQVDDDAPAPVEKLTRFVLTDQTSQEFSSDELKGKVWIGSFFFASCPTTCTAQNHKVRALVQEFSDTELQSISITCDPDNDTPTALEAYAKNFNADVSTWRFLTHTDFKYIKQVANDFFNLALGQLTHSDQVCVFDRDGQIAGVYSILKPKGFADCYSKIEELLQSPAHNESDDQTDDVSGSAADPVSDSADLESGSHQ